MSTLNQLVVVNELDVRAFCPTPQTLVKFITKRAHGNGKVMPRAWKKCLRLPNRDAPMRSPCRQQIQRDVVQGVGARGPSGCPAKARAINSQLSLCSNIQGARAPGESALRSLEILFDAQIIEIEAYHDLQPSTPKQCKVVVPKRLHHSQRTGSIVPWYRSILWYQGVG